MEPAALPEIERTVSAIGAKVAHARKERGWSLAQLAQRAGLSPAAVHKVEKSGMTPTIASLMKIASALGKSVSYFVEEPATPDVSVVRAEQREPADVPVVFGGRDGGLQQYANRLGHKLTLSVQVSVQASLITPNGFHLQLRRAGAAPRPSGPD